MFDFNTLKFILIVAVILSSAFIISRNYFLKRYNKVETALTLIGLVFAIPSFLIIQIDILWKIGIIIPIIVIIIIIKYWESLRGEKIKKVTGNPSDFEG